MPVYNPYTNTSDMPIVFDFYPKDNNGNIRRFPSITSQEKNKARNDYQLAMIQWIAKYNIPQSIIDEWNKATQNNINTDTSWWQNVKDKVSSTVNNIIQQGQNLLSNGGESVKWAPLLPFKPLMVNALKRKGENVSVLDKMSKISPLFKARVIEQKNNFNYADVYHNEEVVGQVAEQLTPQAVESIVSLILSFIKGIADKIKNKAQLTEEERKINEDAEKVADNVTNGGSISTTGTITPSNNWFYKNKILIIGVLAVVLFLAFRKK